MATTPLRRSSRSRRGQFGVTATYLNNSREIEINLPIYLLVRSLGPYGVENVLVDRFEIGR